MRLRTLLPGGAASLRWRALVLAAGHGARLRPLTIERPKPLMPVLGSPILQRTLTRLETAGCEATAINLHHRGRDIVDEMGERFGEMPLHYSWEEEIRGTLGALAPLREFFAGCEAVVVVNGDTLCRWPIEALLRRHRRRDADATLLLSARADPRRFGGGVGVAADGRIVDFGARENGDESVHRRVFAGAQALAPELLQRVPDGFAGLVTDLYEPMLSEGRRIASLTTRRRWHDLGTPQRLLEGVLDRARGLVRRSWISPGADVDDGAAVRGSVIEAGSWVAAGARVERSLVLPGSRIESGCRVRGTVIGFEALVPAGTEITARLVTRARAEAGRPAGSSRLGHLVLSPLEPMAR